MTLGGGDHENHTLKVIQALQKIDIHGLEATVVIGASNPHARVLEAAARQSRVPIRLIQNARNMPELMAWADVAVSGGGSTVWELAFMGVPTVLFMLADNQSKVAEALHRVGAVVSLEQADGIDLPELVEKLEAFLKGSERLQMVQRMRTLVDGQGVSRVMMYITGEKLRLRRACEEDCRMLWEWANDPDVRAAAFSSDPIPWEEHVGWYTKKLSDPHCFHFIALDDEDVPVGQVRFDVQGEEAEVDVSVDRQRRGHGYGSSLIEIGVKKMFLSTPTKVIHAYVKSQNEASVRAFRRAGFRDLGVKLVRKYQAIHLKWTKNDE